MLTEIVRSQPTANVNSSTATNAVKKKGTLQTKEQCDNGKIKTRVVETTRHDFPGLIIVD